jgi:hypothetical protein
MSNLGVYARTGTHRTTRPKINHAIAHHRSEIRRIPPDDGGPYRLTPRGPKRGTRDSTSLQGNYRSPSPRNLSRSARANPANRADNCSWHC